MIRACIIGVSGYGEIHYGLLTAEQANGNVEIIGAAIINQDEEAEKCAHLRSIGCEIFDDYTVMLQTLAGQADLCCIPTGTPLHRPMTVAALEAGMHVFVEKPAAGCMEDVRAMQAAAETAGKQVAVGYQQMYDPTTLQLKRAILDGTIGQVQAMKCRVAWPRDSHYYNRNNWAGRLRLGDTWVLDSPMNNAVAHDLMMMLFLAGPTEHEAATPVSVTAELYRANPIESTDTVCLRIVTDTGIPLLFYATHASRGRIEPELHVRGSAGKIRWTHDKATIETPAAGVQTLDKLGGAPVRASMIRSILDMAAGGPSLTCSLEVASKQTMAITAAHESCEIQTVPGEEESLENGATRKTIPGICDTINHAFDQERLFQETNANFCRDLPTQ